jgi:hypothetical protein
MFDFRANAPTASSPRTPRTASRHRHLDGIITSHGGGKCNASAKCPGGISTCQDCAKYNAKYNANPGGITTNHGGGKYICKRR